MKIGELAALAGVSTRTVRHYHHLGLLPEPRRLANGYRVYGLRDAVALARVRRLTGLGLGLDEVRDVLADGSGGELRETLAGLDADLARQEAAIRARRVRLATLLRRAEDGTLPAEGPVSEELTVLFADLARAADALPGPEPVMAAKDREVLTLLETVAGPREREALLPLLRSAVGTPDGVRQAYEAYALLDALDARTGTDDPRVDAAARALVALLPPGAVDGFPGHRPGAGDAFLAAFFADFTPAQAEALRRTVHLLTGEDTPE
ncbi:MerR family transcriptional regulator [Streptomyces eurocidicus]|uniref:DNA-binding transcriptional MerR regulator n=1 Tax=Streptomyces eurocidicus TaxID=66423 RepID=A0A2N8P3S5_STREU|nr:MerR family transcriptional regulator [Streptomyces eurocidicus]MBB5121099.1 DNA-binding transcriptional MerR regulator [Streptomyces eurocidicus]MBF6054120.1 MerR family DNA-binding transcriptional regulator [Streptomyces eurocidicus]PNE35675.1 MerR family transcriptional regulator [Streptomyces eurocidicus]